MLNEAAEHEITMSGLRARCSTGSQVGWSGSLSGMDIWTEAESSQGQFTVRWVEFIWKASEGLVGGSHNVS